MVWILVCVFTFNLLNEHQSFESQKIALKQATINYSWKIMFADFLTVVIIFAQECIRQYIEHKPTDHWQFFRLLILLGRIFYILSLYPSHLLNRKSADWLIFFKVFEVIIYSWFSIVSFGFTPCFNWISYLKHRKLARTVLRVFICQPLDVKY